MLQTRKSNPQKPPRVLIYGLEGVGKSTFGALSDAPVFISAEGGTDQLKNARGESVDEIPDVRTFDDVRKAIKNLTEQAHDFKTLVIDSADWVEKVCHQQIIGDSGLDIVRVNKGYGAGYRESEKLHKVLIDELTALREKRMMGVILTAHAHVKPVKDPSMVDDFDQFEIKCHEMVSSLWREWVDALGFARFKVFTKKNDEGDARAFGDGSRTIHWLKNPAFQAKNRYGLPATMDFNLDAYQKFMQYARRGVVMETAEEVYAECVILLEKVADADTKAKATDAVVNATGKINELLAMRKRLREITNTKGE